MKTTAPLAIRLPVRLQAVLYGRVPRRLFTRLFVFVTERVWRGFEVDARQAVRCNEQTLVAILHRHRHTEFGRARGFTEILAAASPLEEFRRRVPVCQYRDYEQAMHRMAGGERNVLIADRVVFFAPSSGTTGKSKMIPITERSMRTTLRTLLLSRALLGRALPRGADAGRGISLVRMADYDSRTAGGIPTGDASAEGMRRAAWIIPYLYTTPLAAARIADKPSALFVHLLFGLRERNLSHISATFAHYVVQLFRTLEEHWPQLLASIASGRLPAELKITAWERAKIEAWLHPDPALADALRPEFDRGFRGIARRVWPQFACVVAVATGSFEAYVPKLREYLGDALICNLLYGATEASMGVNIGVERPREYALIPRSCVFEFIPLENADDATPATVGLGELQTGRQYEIVVTSDAGFYRYRMDDVVRVTGFRTGNPLVEFAFRRGTMLNVAAEKTTEQQVGDVVRDLSEQWLGARGRLVDYTVVADTQASPPRYRFLVEIDAATGLLADTEALAAARFMDRRLAEANVDFAIMRRSRVIGEPLVEFLQPGTFEEYLDWARGLRGTPSDNTLKIPRLIKNEAQLRFFEERRLGGRDPLRRRHSPGQ